MLSPSLSCINFPTPSLLQLFETVWHIKQLSVMGVWNSCPCDYKRLGKFPILKAVIGQLCGLVRIIRKNKEILSLYEINSDGHGPG